MLRRFLTFLVTLPLAAQTLTPHKLTYAPSQSITLNVPAPFTIDVAATGLHRVRFLTQSPDGRIFATGMYNLADNTQGSIFILEGWNPTTHRFTHISTYLDHLRNPNNLAFYTDPATHQTWLYLPLTDRLDRFPYHPGDEHPTAPPQILIRFPDYGLNYKYGGWHLTRTVALADLHGHTRLYVAAGSSCDYCKEREVIRASIISMNPDGSDQRMLAHGMRNAVDLRFVTDLDGGSLFNTNMGDDHLGTGEPEDTFFELDSNAHLGPISRASAQTDDSAIPNALHPPHALAPALIPVSLRTEGARLQPCHTNCDEAAASAAEVSLAIPSPPGAPSPQPSPNYGWPTCFFAHGKATLDTTPLPDMPPPDDPNTQSERPADSSYGAQPGMYKQGTLTAAAGGRTNVTDPNANLGPVPAPLTDCSGVPLAYTTFPAHSSPLGLAFFGPDNPTLHNTFLVALHGASRPRIGTGYGVARFTPENRTPQPFITGFLTEDAGKPTVHGRPCGLLRLAPDTFLLTDDKLGLVYYIHPRS